MIKANNQQLIERYLMGELTNEEAFEVELKIMTDKEFSEMYTGIKATFDYIRYSGRKDLIGKMEDWEEKLSGLKLYSDDPNIEMDRYLNGKMLRSEKSAFEEKVKNDPVLERELDEMLNFAAGIRYAERRKLLSRMDRAEAGLPAMQSRKSRGIFNLNRKMLAIAAGLAILMTSIFVIRNIFPGFNEEKTFTSVYQVYAHDLFQRSSQIPPETKAYLNSVFPLSDPQAVYEAFRFYDSKQFDKASIAFSALINLNNNPTLEFYLGQSLLADNRPDLAVISFNKYLDSGELNLRDQTMWYKGLALLKLGRTKDLKEFWRDFSASDCFFCKKAKSILNDMPD